MEQVTVGQIGTVIAFLAAFVGGVAYLKGALKKWLTEALSDEFKAINAKIDTMEGKIDRVDMEACKNFLVRCLADIESGDVDEIERERFWEQYEHYINSGHNSYIKRKVEQLTEEGKL